VELTLWSDPDGAATLAARAAVAQARLLEGEPAPSDAWWRAGLADAVEREPELRPGSTLYETALSPRSTRGATRA